MALSSKSARGIEIELGGNTTKLKAALDEANRSIRTTKTELTTLKNSLKLEWDPGQFKRAQELAQRAMQQTEEKAEILRKGLAELDKLGDAKNTQQYEAIRRELSYVEVAAQKARRELEEINHLEFTEAAKKLDEAIKTAGASVDATAAKLDTVRTKLEQRWDAGEFQNAQALAREAIEKTEEKAEALRKKLQSLEDAGTDKASSEYLELEAALARVEKAAIEAQKELKSINDLKLDRIKESAAVAADHLDKIGNALSVGVTAPLTAAGTAAFKFSSDLDESLNKADVAFGRSAERVTAWSDTTLRSVGLAKGSALDMAANFGDMATSLGLGQDAAAGMSMALVELAGDLASFKNKGIDQVQTALKGIFTGESESLKELGVVMTQDQLAAYAMAQGIQTAYKDMSIAEQVTLRYQYVLDATKNAQGDFARTSDGAANQTRLLQESLKEAAATLGGELLPVVTPIISKLAELVQGFSELDENQRKAVVQTGLFLAALGPAMKLAGGAATAVKAGVAAYQALTAAQTASTAAQTGLNAAMAANPIGAVATAVGALVAVLGAWTLSAHLTAEKTNELTDKTNRVAEAAERARKAYAEQAEELKSQERDTGSMIGALEYLIQAEEKTAAQKAAILGLVEDLNQAVPGLTLAYNEQADALNLTAEQLRAVAEAEYRRQEQAQAAERLKEAYTEQISINDALAEAEAGLAAAQAKQNQMMEEGTWWAIGWEEKSREVTGAVKDAEKAVKAATDAQAKNNAEISGLEKQYGAFTGVAEGAAAALDETGAAAEEASEKATALSTVLEQAAGSYNLLTKAQNEMNESGYLSLDTVSSLLEKYPELSGYLVEAKDGYQLAQGALEDYLAAQRREYDLALNEAEEAAAKIIDNEALEAAGYDATTMSIRRKLEAMMAMYSLQATEARNAARNKYGDDAIGRAMAGADQDVKAATNNLLAAQKALLDLDQAMADLDTYDRVAASLRRDGGGGKRGSSGSSSSGKEKTQAERDLETYQTAVKELDHLRAMDLLSEEEYYQRKAALGDRYLTGNLEERRKLDEELYQWQKGAYDRELEALEEALEAEQITREEYLAGMRQAINTHLKEGSQERIEAERSYAAAERKAKDDAYQEELDDLEYFRDLDIVSESEYYRRLEILRDTYLERDSDAWRRATVELYQYREEQRKAALESLQEAHQSALDAAERGYEESLDRLEEWLKQEQDALKERYEEEKTAAKNALNDRKEIIRKELEAERDRLDQVLEGIDAEIAARKALREDENQDDAIARARKRLEAAKAQRAYARNDEDRAEWDKEIVRLEEALAKAIQDKEDTAFYREKEAEKEAVRDQKEQASDAAQLAQDQAQADYEAKLKELEAVYQAGLADAQGEYNRRAEAEKDSYDARVDFLERQYQEDLDRRERGSTTTAQGVALGNLLSGVTAAVQAAAGVIQRQTQVISTTNKSASVTVNQGGSMTEGQIKRAVQKVLDAMDK